MNKKSKMTARAQSALNKLLLKTVKDAEPVEMVVALLHVGANPNCRDERGVRATPLIHAVCSYWLPSEARRLTSAFEKAGADFTLRAINHCASAANNSAPPYCTAAQFAVIGSNEVFAEQLKKAEDQQKRKLKK